MSEFVTSYNHRVILYYKRRADRKDIQACLKRTCFFPCVLLYTWIKTGVRKLINTLLVYTLFGSNKFLDAIASLQVTGLVTLQILVWGIL